MSDKFDIGISTITSNLESSQEEIVIEITGLKSINKFIGLEDTPVYYDNGKFFKVEDNKIIYTDITWEDIKGNIHDNPEVINEIEKLVEETSKSYTIKIVDEAISVHNSDENSHPYIQQIIENNYETLDNKIDLNKYNTDEDIRKVNERIDTNDKQIEDLQSFTNDLRSDLDNLTVEVEVDVKNSIAQLDEKVDGININLTKQIDDLEQDVNDKYNELIRDIDDLTDVVEEDYATLNTKIDTTTQTINTRITNVADELNQTIEENVIALQQEDTALQNQINAHSQTLTAHDTRITSNTNAITKEISDRQSADDELSDRIDAVESRGRFLALWNAVTGLPESTPQITPYTYKTGDYYIVDAVGETNYRPSGTEFVEGQPSTEVETEELTTDDVYYYDGSVWRLQVNHGKTVSFGNLTGQPSDNTALKQVLDSKQNVITNLSTIESNAQAGKNASDTIATYGDIVTHNANEFATTTALTQGLATKQNETDNNLVTTAKTVVGAVNELDAKIKDIQLYKFPNAIIIGQPTINNGQISGFSQQNYLTLPFLFDVGDRAFEFNYAFRTSDNVTTAQNLFGSNYCIASYIQNGKLNVRVSGNGTSWDVVSLETNLNVLPNTVYYIKLEFNRLRYLISASTDGVQYSEIGNIVNTTKPIAGNVFIGIGNNQNNPFLGVINLNRWDIRLNNSIIWEGMDDVGLATRADISLSNLDELGEARFTAKQDVLDIKLLEGAIL